MEHLSKVINNDKIFDKLIENEVEVSLKIDGAAFQVTCDEDGNIEWHKRSGNSLKPGPIIDDFTLLYSPHLYKAINFFKEKSEELKKYRFITFEIFNDNYILLSAVEGDKLIEDYNKLNEIADSLSVDIIPILFRGKLTEEQCAFIKTYYNGPDIDFIQFLKLTFGFDANKYSKYLKNQSEIEGVVLNFNVGNKKAQYKIVDKDFTDKVKKKSEEDLEAKSKTKETAEKLTLKMLDWMKEHAKKLDNNKWESLHQNLYNMLKNASLMNQLLNIGAKLPAPKFNMVNELIKDDLKRLIKKHGQPLVNVVDNFFIVFNKKRTRHYIISKEVQQEINGVVDRI